MRHLKISFMLFLSLILMSKAFTQTTADLDKKKGFKDFTLGDPYSKWKSNLKLQESSNGESWYFYTGTCCQQVFEYDLKQILLMFKNDTLKFITLLTETDSSSTSAYPSSQYKSIKNSFISLFGTGTESMKNTTLIYKWAGDKIVLRLQYNYLGVKSGGYTTSNCHIMLGYGIAGF